MQLYTHNSDSSNPDEDMRCDSFMASLIFWAGVVVAAGILALVMVGLPLYFGTLQFSDFFSFGRQLWAGRTGS